MCWTEVVARPVTGSKEVYVPRGWVSGERPEVPES